MTERLGKYELRGEVGSGAAGVVYDAWDPDLARRVAIKRVMLAGRTQAEQEELRARFRQEAQIVGRLAHPGVVAVHDYGEADGSAYLVMAFVDGRSLAARLRAEGTLPVPEAIRIATAILAALGHCHAAGVLHRDVKPGNVLLGHDGSVALTDFGVAHTAASELTAQGTLIGTPAYMAPEQFDGGTLDGRTDLYACGVVLYEMLTGRKPFDGELFAVMHQVRSVAPPSPAGFVALPPGLAAVVMRALSKRPADRFATAAAFAAALEPFRNPAPGGKGGRMWWAAGLGAAVLAVGGLGLAWWVRPPASPMAVAPAAPASATASVQAGSGPMANSSQTPVSGPPGGPNQAPGSSPPAGPVQAPASGPPTDQNQAPASSLPTRASQAPASAAATPLDAIATLRRGVDALPCAAVRLVAVPDPPRVVVRGLVGDASRPVLSALLAGFASVVEADHVEALAQSAGTCAALSLVQAYHGTDARLDLPDGRGRLHDGAPIRLALRMPAFAGFVRLDYLTEDGRLVVHLDQDHLAAHAWPADARVLLGPRGDGVIGTVGAPYGRDLMLATVSSVPLLRETRPQQEPAAPYLRALRAAMAAAAADGARLAADAERLETAPR